MKTVLKVAKKAFGAASIYMAIFLGLVIAFSTMSNGDKEKNFRAEQMDIVILDKDNSTLSKALTNYLAVNNRIKEVENEELIPDLLFNGVIDYVVHIDQGFEEKVKSGDYKDALTEESIRANAAFLDQKINLFVRYVRIELASGKDMESAGKSVIEVCKVQASTEMVDGKSGMGFGQMTPAYYFFSYLAYVLPAALIMILGPILQEFYQKDVKMRTDCSRISTRKQNMTIIGGMSIIAVVLFFIFILTGTVIGIKSTTVDAFLLGVANGFLFLLISICISSIIGMLVRGNDALNGASNLISMGMAFLCGIFVPGEFLPEYVKKISNFLPGSWYMKNVLLLFNAENFKDNMNEFFKNCGVQLIFITALFCIALVTAKKRRTA